MPAGAKPGERRGGRQKGSSNRAKQIEREMADDNAVKHVVAKLGGPEAVLTGSPPKLAKEVLEDFMKLFAGMAAYYQPRPPQAATPNPNSNEDKFLRYAELACEAAKSLAKYQSPTFKAVIIAPAPERGESTKRFTLTIFDTNRRPAIESVNGKAPADTQH